MVINVAGRLVFFVVSSFDLTKQFVYGWKKRIQKDRPHKLDAHDGRGAEHSRGEGDVGQYAGQNLGRDARRERGVKLGAGQVGRRAAPPPASSYVTLSLPYSSQPRGEFVVGVAGEHGWDRELHERLRSPTPRGRYVVVECFLYYSSIVGQRRCVCRPHGVFCPPPRR